MGYVADLPGRAPGRPDLRPTRDAAQVRAEYQANQRRRRLQAAAGMTPGAWRNAMRAPTSSKGE